MALAPSLSSLEGLFTDSFMFPIQDKWLFEDS